MQMNSQDSTRRAAASVLGAVNNGGSNEPVARDAEPNRVRKAPSRKRMQTAIRAAFEAGQGSARVASRNNLNTVSAVLV